MAQTVTCRLVTGQSWESGSPEKTSEKSPFAILDIYKHSGGKPQRLHVLETQTLVLKYGDRIKCVSGKTAVLINPGTQAGIFVLVPDMPSCVEWNYRTELVMNDETTKRIVRNGKISAAPDIGNTTRATSATTR